MASKTAKLTETESRMMLTRAWENREGVFQGTNLQLLISSGYIMHSTASHQQYCIINFKSAKRLDLTCSHYKREMIIM